MSTTKTRVENCNYWRCFAALCLRKAKLTWRFMLLRRTQIHSVAGIQRMTNACLNNFSILKKAFCPSSASPCSWCPSRNDTNLQERHLKSIIWDREKKETFRMTIRLSIIDHSIFHIAENSSDSGRFINGFLKISTTEEASGWSFFLMFSLGILWKNSN